MSLKFKEKASVSHQNKPPPTAKEPKLLKYFTAAYLVSALAVEEEEHRAPASFPGQARLQHEQPLPWALGHFISAPIPAVHLEKLELSQTRLTRKAGMS